MPNVAKIAKSLTKIAKPLYVIVAFLGSWLTSPFSPLLPYPSVYAQETERADQADVVHRLGSLEERVYHISDSVSTIQGVGSGALGVLGVLQIVGMLGAKRKEQ